MKRLAAKHDVIYRKKFDNYMKDIFSYIASIAQSKAHPWILGVALSTLKDNLEGDWLNAYIGNLDAELLQKPTSQCKVRNQRQ